MLEYNLNGDILEVVQINFSFHKTSKEYWYYNIKEWTKTITGQRNDIPRYKMDQASIDWVKKFYIPKVIKP